MKPIDKANAAIRLKENEDFKLIMKCVEADIFDAFKNVKLGDSEALKTVHDLSHGFKLLGLRVDKYIELAVFEASKDEDR
ncbi:hypothetical protein [Rhizobium sp. Root482]|uniref:hypothetical protein n=1 Tax=Rhizobium sp. Root482 TaxID=1736543 RepID=UPI0007011782|nr:hypothetical protein [Rhizobium sp. Root482]KQY14423.1 hypothetical protein ASD31_09145 [Rhizobium sp. Root482]